MPQIPTVPIAVILPVHNGERYLATAIDSVLRQTYTEFELLVVDDGSTDRSPEIVRSYKDRRVRLVTLDRHEGLVSALNTGIRETQSEFVARMDADDISLPRRFERQRAFLQAHPEVGICGTFARNFGDRRGVRRVPVQHADIRARLFFGWAMDHPTLFMRRDVVERHALYYNDDYRNTEDLDLLIRAAEVTQLANLSEVLLLYRVHAASVTATLNADQNDLLARLLRRQLRNLVPDATPDEEAFHSRVALNAVRERELDAAERWLLRLGEENRRTARYDIAAFARQLRRKWFELHRYGVADGFGTLSSYWHSSLHQASDVGLPEKVSLVARSLTRRFLR